MKAIPLSKGLVALVDDIDFVVLSAFKWCSSEKAPGHVHAVRRPRGQQGGALVHMHRSVMNAPKGMVVDHINGNTLDNRRSNLRVVTHKENIRHRAHGANRNSGTGVRGVSFCKTRGRYIAGIKVDGKKINLGRFDSIDAAAQAYAEASVKFFKLVPAKRLTALPPVLSLVGILTEALHG